MNRTWLILIVVAIVLVLALGIYQIAITSSGQNVEFNKSVITINDDLGAQVLTLIEKNSENMPINSGDLDNR